MTTEASRTLFGEQIKDICDQMGVEKSDAFPRWICQNILGITGEANIDEAVSIGGKNDYGVDIFYADETGDITEQYVCWIQAKFGEDLDRTAKREDLESFASTLGHLRDCPDSANQTFKQKSAEFIRMEAQYPHIKKRMIFAVTGRLNEQSREMVSNPRWLEEKFGAGGGRDANVDFEVLDLDEILSRMTIRHTPTLSVKFDGDVITRTDPTTGKKSVIGYVAADDLVRMAAEHRETIFLENPQQTLGKGVPTHKAILNTLEDADGRRKFWKLNNGITAICTGFEAADDGTCRIENFKVVNGRQTTYTLENHTGSRDGVYLLMIVHEAVDDTERNEISEATNTQNPIKPVDLVTNYPEMTDLVLQCRNSFCDFYFERQTKGFKSAKKSTQNRVTWRRVLEKSAAARAYYAYEIDPNEAMLPDKILFSVAGNGGGGGSGHYDRIFRNRDIADLIIPHIFMSMLEGLHRRWCAELKGRQSGELSRSKGIISKDIVKYYLLHFIYKSMLSIDESERQRIKGRLIGTFRSLGRRDGDPDAFQSIAKLAYDIFMLCFDTERRETWPPALLEKIGSDRYEADERDVPTPYDIMYMLRHNGPKIILDLLRARDHQIKQVGDNVRAELLKL